MFNKEMISIIRSTFHDKFDDLSDKDSYIIESKEQLLSLVNDADIQNDVDDALNQVIASVSILGYYIGLSDGAKVLNSLMAPNLAEQLLSTHDELI